VSLGDVVVYLVVGLIAGFLASRIVLGKGRGWLAGLLHVSINIGPSILNQIIIAFVGAVILLLIWRLLFRGRK